jgi:hypothetical protein
MKCLRCGEPLPFVLCPECGGETPEDSHYCCRCGKPIRKDKDKGEEDFSERTPCSDGNCIGTINEEGICNICKKPYR